jgi:hypothetical protein
VHTATDFDRSVQALLDMIGGEPLAGSGSKTKHRSPNMAPRRRNSTVATATSPNMPAANPAPPKRDFR